MGLTDQIRPDFENLCESILHTNKIDIDGYW